jgi:hypothetical protein
MTIFPSKVGFRSGTLRSRDVAYILAEDEDLVEQDKSHTVVLTWHNGNWFRHFLEWVAKSACVVRTPKSQLVAIEGAGRFLVFGQGEVSEGVITIIPTPDGKLGPFRKARAISGDAYAVGLGGLAMKRSVSGQWIAIDRNLPSEADLESIAGFSDTELYAVGWRGQIWRYDGHLWHLVASPANSILTEVVCAPDGLVYCVGQMGVILRGRDDSWEEVQQNNFQADLWGAEWFNGGLWVSTMTSVYSLVSGNLQSANFGEDHPETAYELSAADGQLWSIGRKDIMAHDGEKWRRIE